LMTIGNRTRLAFIALTCANTVRKVVHVKSALTSQFHF
jgi:hypothetical protein